MNLAAVVALKLLLLHLSITLTLTTRHKLPRIRQQLHEEEEVVLVQVGQRVKKQLMHVSNALNRQEH